MTIQQPENVANTVTVDSGKVLAYLNLNPNDPKAQAVVAVAQRYDLDPVLKHVIVIPKGGVYVTRDGLLHVAHRSGQLDGIVVDQEPTLSDDGREWVARVSVYRKDMRHPFTFPGRYPVNGGNRDYAQEMALKAAEAHALRRAFDVTGIPALDEQRPGEQPPRAAVGGLGAILDEQDDEPAAEPQPELLDPQSDLGKALYAGLREAGITNEERPGFIASVIGRTVTSSREMTADEARLVLDHLSDQEPVDGEVVE